MPPSCPRPASAVSFADDEEEAISREDEYGVNEAEEEEQPNDEIAHSSSAKKTTIEERIRRRTIESSAPWKISRPYLNLKFDLDSRDPSCRISSEPEFPCRLKGTIKNSERWRYIFYKTRYAIRWLERTIVLGYFVKLCLKSSFLK